MSSSEASVPTHAPDLDPSAPPVRRSRRTILLAIATWTAIVLVALFALYRGTMLRFAFFDFVAPIHVQADNARLYGWGYYTWYNIHDRGRSFLDTYDDAGIQPRGNETSLDATPGELAVSTAWVRFNHGWLPYAALPKGPPRQAGQIPEWSRATRDFWAWFIDFNTVFEAIGCIGAFLLTRQVLRDAGTSPLRSNLTALVAALLLWFNFAMILNGYGIPGTEVWVVPPFLWAVYLCRRGNWAWGGAALAIGSLLKAQTLLVLPIFLLWPIFQCLWQHKLHGIRVVLRGVRLEISEDTFLNSAGQRVPFKRQTWRAPAALVGGFVGVFGLATCGWTLTRVDAEHVRHIARPALVFAIALPIVTLALAIVRRLVLPRVSRERRWVAPTVMGLLIVLPIIAALWPCFAWTLPQTESFSARRMAYGLLVGLAIVSACGVHFANRWQTLLTMTLGLFGAAALASMLLFSTRSAWLDTAYLAPFERGPQLIAGLPSNFPAILHRRFGWAMDSGSAELFALGPAWYTLNGTVQVTLQSLLTWLTAILLVLTALGIALHDRRRSPRFLAAIVTPWLLLFVLPCGVEERWLLVAAATASVCVGHAVGGALMSIFLSAVTVVMTMHAMLRTGPGLGSPVRRLWNHYLRETHPDWFARDSRFAQDLHRYFDGTFPDIGWAVLMATLIFLWLTLTPAWPRRRNAEALLVTPPGESPEASGAPSPAEPPAETLSESEPSPAVSAGPAGAA